MPVWPCEFDWIKTELVADLNEYQIDYISIEQRGSTSVPGLLGKDCIDVLNVVDDESMFDKIEQALAMGNPFSGRAGGYRCVGNSGIRGRLSFKLFDILSNRHVYVTVSDSIYHRANISGRETLRAKEDLREEYGVVKLRLAEKNFHFALELGRSKDNIIRKILKVAGWAEAGVDVKESLCVTKSREPWRPY